MGEMLDRDRLPPMKAGGKAAVKLVCTISVLLLASDISLARSGRGQFCLKPVRYRIGQIDPNFGLDGAGVAEALRTAAKLWNTAAGADLVDYDSAGDLEVDFVYGAQQAIHDHRMATLGEIARIRTGAAQFKSDHDSLERQSLELQTGFSKNRSRFEEKLAAYDKRLRAFDQARGPDELGRMLSEEKSALDREGAALAQEQDRLNDLASQLNSLASKYNSIIGEERAYLEDINRDAGKVFTAGEFILKDGRARIAIYEFGNRRDLIAVAAHEFGHALRLRHVKDDKAIMSALREDGAGLDLPERGEGIQLTSADIVALKSVCGSEN